MFSDFRILPKIIATWGRSLYGLVCRLFIGWWVLAALGKADFGFYSVVGMTMIVLLAMWLVYGGIAVVKNSPMMFDAW